MQGECGPRGEQDQAGDATNALMWVLLALQVAGIATIIVLWTRLASLQARQQPKAAERVR
jgi:hypothetical protein